MSEMLDKLKAIGAQKIYEETHIPVEHVQAIIHESFEGFTKVQFLGFISILEREYKGDLSALRTKGLEHFNDSSLFEEDDHVFIAPQKKKKFTLFYILLAVCVFAVAVYFSFEQSTQDTRVIQPIDNSEIEDAQKNITSLEQNESNESNETLTSVDINASTPIDVNQTVVEEEIVEPTLSIVAKTKVWLGYIDLKTNKHYTKTFKGEFTLDTSKEWLLVFGHGFIDIVVNDEIQKFSSRDQVRFVYKDGALKAVTKREFKKLNRGRSW